MLWNSLRRKRTDILDSLMGRVVENRNQAQTTTNGQTHKARVVELSIGQRINQVACLYVPLGSASRLWWRWRTLKEISRKVFVEELDL